MEYAFKEIYPMNSCTLAVGTDNRIYGSGFSYGCLDENYFDNSASNGYKEIEKHITSDNVKLISYSYTSSFFIKKDDDSILWAIGSNDRGQLGLPAECVRCFNATPVPFPEDVKNIIKIKTPSRFTLILTNTNNLYVAGYSSCGAMGTGTSTNCYGFTLIATDVVEFYNDGSAYNTYIKKTDGSYWGTGENAYGILGVGHKNKVTTFTKISDGTDIIKIVPGHQALFILKTDNTLWGCGRNNSYQLGLGNATQQVTLIQVATDVVDCWAGDNKAIYKKSDGTFWGSGYTNTKNFFILDNYSTTSYIKKWTKLGWDSTVINKIFLNFYITIIEKTDGTFWACGDNYNGVLCPSVNEIKDYIQIEELTDMKEFTNNYDSFVVIKNDGTILQSGSCDGEGSFLYCLPKYRTFTPIWKDKNPDRIVPPRYYNTIFHISEDNTLYGLGGSGYGEFGINDVYYINNFNYPMATNVKRVWSAEELTIYETLDNKLYIAGIDYGGIAGNGTQESDYMDAPVEVQITDVQEIFLPRYCAYNAFALKTDGTLWAAGYNTYGELGLGHANDATTWTKVNITDVKKVYNNGCWYTYILKNDGTLWNAGESYAGCLGTSSTANRTSFVKVLENVKDCIITDINNVYVLKNDGTVWVTGYNYQGVLGLGHSNPITSFTKLTDNVKEIHGEEENIFFIKNDNTLWCMGINSYGSLGVNISQSVPLTQVPVTFDVTKIKKIVTSLSNETTFIILNDNTCYFAGSNIWGQTGCNILQSGLSDKIFDRFTPYLSFDECAIKGTQVAINKEVVTIQNAAAGSDHEAIIVSHEAVADDNFIYVRGKNDFGQLGLGDFDERPEYTKVEFANCKEISCGHNHTVILNDNGEMFIAGKNDKGQLGDGTFENKNVFTKNDSISNVHHVKAIKDITVIEVDGDIYHTNSDNPEFTMKE